MKHSLFKDIHSEGFQEEITIAKVVSGIRKSRTEKLKVL